jgi:hypothetical protein
MPGLSTALTGQEVQSRLGQIANDLDRLFASIEGAQDFFQAHTDADLQNLFGIGTPDATALRAAYADLEQLRKVYRGQDELTPAKNFRLTVREIYGLRT